MTRCRGVNRCAGWERLSLVLCWVPSEGAQPGLASRTPARRFAIAAPTKRSGINASPPARHATATPAAWQVRAETIPAVRPRFAMEHAAICAPIRTAEPAATIAAFTAMPPYSHVVVHGDGPAYYDAKDIPHGTVTRHIYHSNVTNGMRDLYVYTPPNYDPKKTYPTLYLLGGSGELPSNWMYDGRANLILDNLIAEGKAIPMVMVLPNNQIIHRNHPNHVELTFKLFEKELREHIVPLVEKNYNVRHDPKGRALSGLSMGGRHTMFCGFNSLDLFGNFGVLSAGDNDSEKTLSTFLNDPKVNDKITYLFIGQGDQEVQGPLGVRVEGLRKALDNHKIKYEYYVGGGMGHDWSTWRHLLYYRFLPNLWRK